MNPLIEQGCMRMQKPSFSTTLGALMLAGLPLHTALAAPANCSALAGLPAVLEVGEGLQQNGRDPVEGVDGSGRGEVRERGGGGETAEPAMGHALAGLDGVAEVACPLSEGLAGRSGSASAGEARDEVLE